MRYAKRHRNQANAQSFVRAAELPLFADARTMPHMYTNTLQRKLWQNLQSHVTHTYNHATLHLMPSQAAVAIYKDQWLLATSRDEWVHLGSRT